MDCAKEKRSDEAPGTKDSRTKRNNKAHGRAAVTHNRAAGPRS